MQYVPKIAKFHANLHNRVTSVTLVLVDRTLLQAPTIAVPAAGLSFASFHQLLTADRTRTCHSQPYHWEVQRESQLRGPKDFSCTLRRSLLKSSYYPSGALTTPLVRVTRPLAALRESQLPPPKNVSHQSHSSTTSHQQGVLYTPGIFQNLKVAIFLQPVQPNLVSSQPSQPESSR